jgi:drug/metabolite transporter (DMT)-like permease
VPPTHAERSTRLIGIGLLALSTFIFGFSNVMAKYLTREYPIGEALLFRASFAILIVLPFVRVADIARAARASPWLHLLRMALTAIEIVCFYTAVRVLQLADVSTFYLSTPILLTAISALALRERVEAARWAAALVGFAGVLVALKPSSAALSLPALIALSGSLLYSIFLAITRRLRHTPNTVLILSQLVALTLCGAVTIPFAWTPPGWSGGAMMAAVGLFGIGGYFCVNRALQLAPASVIAPFQYLSIVWSILLGYLVFGDVPVPSTLIGAALIIAAGGYLIFRERQTAAA